MPVDFLPAAFWVVDLATNFYVESMTVFGAVAAVLFFLAP